MNTTDDVEMRVCGDSSRDEKDMLPLYEVVAIYVQ